MSAPDAGPLAGIRVVDLTHILAGPYCTQLMADAGATIIKIEPPGGEYSRIRGPQRRGPGGAFLSSYSAGVNRGKTSLEVDLKQPAGLRLFERLVAIADVVVDNFAPGALARMGVSYDDLRARHPRLVTASISLWGVDAADELARRGGVAVVAEVESTVLHGRLDVDGTPFPVGFPLGDMSSGLACYGAIVGALLARETTGAGRHVTISMVRTLFALNAIAVALAQVPRGAAQRATAAAGLFPTADGWIALSAHTDAGWRGLCAAMGEPGLAGDPRFQDLDGRQDRAGQVNELVTRWTSARPAAELLEALAAHGVPAGRVRRPADALESEAHARAGCFWDVGDGLGGTIRTPASPFGFDYGVKALPLIGEGAAELLFDLLGLGERELAGLAAAGAFGPAAVAR